MVRQQYRALIATILLVLVFSMPTAVLSQQNYGDKGLPLELLFAPGRSGWNYLPSPDGKKILWNNLSAANQLEFRVRELQTNAVRRFTGRLATLWSSDSRGIYYRTGRELNLFDLSENASRGKVLPVQGMKTWLVLGILPQQGSNLIVAGKFGGLGPNNLYQCALQPPPRCEVLSQSVPNLQGWIFDYTGQVVARIRLWADGNLGLEILEDEHWKDVFSIPIDSIFRPLGWADAQGTIWTISNRGRPFAALVKLNIKTGAEEVYFASDTSDVTFVLLDAKAERPLLAFVEADYQERQYFDQEIEAAFSPLEALFSEPFRLEVMGADQGRRTIAVSAVGASRAREVFLVNVETSAIESLARSHLTALSQRFAPSRSVRIPGRDGGTLQAYLTLPNQGETFPRPTVIMMYGGPWIRAHHTLNRTVQYLVSLGYPVLLLNYRGSSGLGKSYQQAAIGNFSTIFQADLEDTIAWAEACGVAAKQEFFIGGESFGGWIALQAMGRLPHLFKGAAVINPLIDPASFFRQQFHNGFALSIWRKYLGLDANATVTAMTETMEVISPGRYLDSYQAPILLIGGQRDSIVRTQYLSEFAEQLKARNLLADLVIYPEEGHAIRRPNNIIDLHKRIAAHLNILNTAHDDAETLTRADVEQACR